MYHFKDSDNNVFAFMQEVSRDGLTAISVDEAHELLGHPSALDRTKKEKIIGGFNLTGLQNDYAAANAADISFTTAGAVTKDFQADPGSVRVIQESLAGCSLSQATPDGFFWVSSDNTHVPFTYADLQGLAATVFARGAANFARLQVAKAAVSAATTVEGVNAVVF